MVVYEWCVYGGVVVVCMVVYGGVCMVVCVWWCMVVYGGVCMVSYCIIDGPRVRRCTRTSNGSPQGWPGSALIHCIRVCGAWCRFIP
jgi:hypothetical protein